MGYWDDDDFKTATGDFVKFDREGDSVSGTITSLGKKAFTDDKTGEVTYSPQLGIRDDQGNERILTAGQLMLQKALIQHQPTVGDHIKVVFTHKVGRVKQFTLEVRKGTPAPADGPPF